MPAGDSDLGIVEKFLQDLQDCSLQIVPSPRESGNFDTVRLVIPLRESDISLETVQLEIADFESIDLEFKSSLYYDRDKAKNYPNAQLNELKSDEVVFSTLKTLCGFLNQDGGRLYIGVNDQRKVIGILDDCKLMNSKVLNVDRWELWLRDKISTQFKDGNSVNNYIRISYFEIDSRCIARVMARKRRELSFVYKQNRYRFYCRQGNRTIEIQIDQMKEYLENRFNI
jgi:predicted HTH transcriptional regulator